MKHLLVMLFLTLAGCASRVNPPIKHKNKLSIVQGLTSSKEVELSVLAPKGQALRFELRSAAGEVISPTQAKEVVRDFSDFVIYKLLFNRNSEVDYNFYAFVGEELVDQRLLGRGQLDNSRLRIAVASCMNDHEVELYSIWDALVAQKPEYLLLIGDNVYADRKGSAGNIPTDPEILWQRYVDVRLALPIYFQDKLIPIHALWDDHDYGLNDGGAEFPHRRASEDVFSAFWAQDLAPENWKKGFGVGGLLSLGDFNLYFLDGRSFRSGSPEGSHLGLDQHAWLLDSLKSEVNPSFLIKGDQFFGGYHHKDSFEGRHPADFARFIQELKKLGTPFNFLSGDRHMSEIMQFPRSLFGTPSFEITSSPLHAVMEPKDIPENPWRVVAELDAVNFTIIDNLAQDDHWFMTVKNIGIAGKEHFRRELAVYIKDLQNNLNESRRRRGRRQNRRRR